jgi:hypothetical protein
LTIIDFDEDNDGIDLEGILTKESFDTRKLGLTEDLRENVCIS